MCAIMCDAINNMVSYLSLSALEDHRERAMPDQIPCVILIFAHMHDTAVLMGIHVAFATRRRRHRIQPFWLNVPRALFDQLLMAIYRCNRNIDSTKCLRIYNFRGLLMCDKCDFRHSQSLRSRRQSLVVIKFQPCNLRQCVVMKIICSFAFHLDTLQHFTNKIKTPIA